MQPVGIINGIQRKHAVQSEGFKKVSNTNPQAVINRSDLLLGSLNSMARLNSISFKGNSETYEIGLSEDELTKRASK